MDLFGFYFLVFTVQTELSAPGSADEVRPWTGQPQVGVGDRQMGGQTQKDGWIVGVEGRQESDFGQTELCHAIGRQPCEHLQ